MRNRAAHWSDVISRMARVSEIKLSEGDIPKFAAQSILDEATLIIPLEGLIDLNAERNRLGKEIDKLTKEIDKVERKLANDDFMARAKPEVIEENRQRFESFKHDKDRLKAALARINLS